VIDLNNISLISSINSLKSQLKTNNIAQVIILEPKETAAFKFHMLCLVNLHLHWDPSKEIVKYIQAAEIKHQVRMKKHRSTGT
jgi:hypothetical protein